MGAWGKFRVGGALAVAALMGVHGGSPARANGHDGMFQKMDTNGDGKISADEHAAGAKKMFEMMDTNKDGKVTAAEMTDHHDKMMALKGEKAEKAAKAEKQGQGKEMSAGEKIKVIDTNNDGVLTAEEHAAGSRTMFDKMDTNRDGTLSKEEMRAGHSKMLHKGNK